MKKILTTFVLLLALTYNVVAQTKDTQLEVFLNSGATHSFPLLATPKATFSGQQMTVTAGTEKQQINIRDVKSIRYSDKGANVCVFQDQYSNLNIDFDQIHFNQVTFDGKPAIRIEAEDLESIVESKYANMDVVTPLSQYADKVSNGKLLHVTPTSKTSNPIITYGKFHVTGSYNVYLVAAPGKYVDAADDLNRTRKVRVTCGYHTYNGASYSSKTTAYSTNPDNETEKLMIDYTDIDTLLVGRAFTSPNIVLDDAHTGSIKFQSQKLSADDTVNDFYLDCFILVPADSEGNELTNCNMLVTELAGVRSFVPTDMLQYVLWQKEQIVVDEEVEIPYGKTHKLTYSFLPEGIKFPSVAMESENPDIASVDAKGVVTGNSIGSTYIVLTDEVGGAVARCKVTVTGTPATANTLIINEVMSANIDQFVDPSFNYGGWIELYNPTDDDLIIARCYVSDDSNDLTKFHLSTKAGTIPAHSYRNIWFDHSDYTADQVPFKLDCDGGTIYFSDANGNLIASCEYPEAIARCSYARKTDGGEEWGWTGNPTPEASNVTSVFATEQVADPVLNRQSCVYNGSIDLSVQISDGAKLIYTTNGSVPTEANSKVAEDGNFAYTNNVVVRFRAIKEGYLPSNVVTRTFINADAYDSQGVDIRQLPIISIVTDNVNLTSNQLGIFVQGTNGRPGNGHSSNYNTNMDWDRPVDFQYLKNGEYVFSQEADIATCGGWSRTYGAHSSFKIKADKKYYGLKTLDYPFFDQKPYLKNKTLQIRNGGNDYNARFMDACLQTIIMSSDLDIDCQSYQPTIHFINGKNTGIINMREPNNKHFVYANYGWDSDEIDMFEMGPDSAYCQMCGTKDAYDEWYELSKNAADPVTYSEICKRVDIDEYANYVAIQLYLNNWDWPQNNLKGFRHRDGGKFRFVVFDLDNSLQRTSNPFNTFAGKKNYTFDTCYPEMTKLTAEIEFVTIFENMLANDEFRKKFIDTFCMIGGTVFEFSRVQDITYNLLNRVGDIQYNLEGYQKSPYNTAYSLISAFYDDDYNSNYKLIRNLMSYSKFGLKDVPMQNCVIASAIEGDEDYTAPILYNGMKMPTNYFNGRLFAPVTLTAQPLAGKKFDGWYDLTSGKKLTADAEYTLPAGGDDIQVVAHYSNVSRYEALKQGITPVRINEVSAANTVYANDYNKREDWVEFYNTTDAPINMAGMFVTDNPDKPEKYQIKADAGENTIIPAHGYKVMWFDKKSGVSQLHAPYKLDDDGDVLYLSAKDHSWTDSLVYVAHDGNHTVGRYPDGTDNVYVMSTPTIEKKNIYSTYFVPVKDGQLDPSIIESVRKTTPLEIAYSDGALRINTKTASDATISIFSIDGRKMMTVNESLVQGTNTVSVNTLASGVYLGVVKTSNRENAMVKFEKQLTINN